MRSFVGLSFAIFVMALWQTVMSQNDPPPDDIDLAADGHAYAAAAAAVGTDSHNPCECQCNGFTYTQNGQTYGNCNRQVDDSVLTYMHHRNEK